MNGEESASVPTCSDADSLNEVGKFVHPINPEGWPTPRSSLDGSAVPEDQADLAYLLVVDDAAADYEGAIFGLPEQKRLADLVSFTIFDW